MNKREIKACAKELMDAINEAKPVVSKFGLVGVKECLDVNSMEDSVGLKFTSLKEEHAVEVFIGYSISETFGYDCLGIIEDLGDPNKLNEYKKWRKVWDVMCEHGNFAFIGAINFKLINGGIMVLGAKEGDQEYSLTLGPHECLFKDGILKFDSLEELATMLDMTNIPWEGDELVPA